MRVDGSDKEYDISTLDAKEHHDTLQMGFFGVRWKTLCIMLSSSTECGKLEPISGIARGELRSTLAEQAFAEVGVVYGRENFRRNCRCRRDYPRCELYGGYQESRHR